MRSAYPAVFLCALACASVPSSASHLSTSGAAVPAFASSSSGGQTHGLIRAGSHTTEYFGGESLYDVLRLREPIYLRPRPSLSIEQSMRSDPLAVYIDGSFAGTWEVLQLLPANTVFSVDRLSATEASLRFGSRNNSSGAIVVTMAHR
jgi:hypothetical protein